MSLRPYDSERPTARSANESLLTLPTVDLYGAVHKGLRAQLGSLCTRLGRLDLTKPAALWTALDDLDGVLFLCEAHVRHEEHAIHPVLVNVGARRRLEGEHADHVLWMEALRTLADRLIDSEGDEALAVVHSLHLSFAAFTAETFLHMDHEEVVVQPILESMLSRSGLEDVEQRLLASIGPEELDAFLRIIVPAVEPTLRVALLQGARQGLPASVYAELLSSLERTLDQLEWRELHARLEVAA